MALTRYVVEYALDSGTEVKIIVSYDEQNAATRLNIGNLSTVSGFCVGAITRKLLEPRFIDHKDLGRIYFRNHNDMVQYISTNKDNIKSYDMERANCAVTQLF